MRTIVLSFEHLPACSIGCYGEWIISTPEFDALASQSLLFENYFVSPQGPSLLELLQTSHADLTFVSSQSSITGYPFSPAALLTAGEVPSLSRMNELFPQGDHRLLFVECIPDSPWMRELVSLATRLPELDPAGTSTETSFPLAISTNETSTGIGEAAQPAERPEVRLDDASTLAACRTWPAWKQRLLAHAAHVQRCDDLLTRWLELLEQILEPDDLLMITAATGDSRRIPDDRPDWLKSLAAPMVHLPLIIHRVESGLQSRLSGFVTPSTVAPLIQNPDKLPDLLQSPGEAVIECRSTAATSWRSAAWLFVEEGGPDSTESTVDNTETEIRLYAKPEDFWERHDLSREYPELIEQYRHKTGPFASGE